MVHRNAKTPINFHVYNTCIFYTLIDYWLYTSESNKQKGEWEANSGKI